MNQEQLGELLIKLGFDDLDGFLKALDGALGDAEEKAKSGGGTGGKKFREEFEKNARPKESFGRDFINALGIISIGTFIGNTLSNAFQSALGATRQFISDSNREFRSYQTSLNIIAASGGDSLEKIRGKIKELSEEGKVFSENQVAQSLSEIIKAGYPTAQAIQLVRSGMQAAKGEIDASTGAYADLGRTTLLVSDVLSGFRKEAGEAAKVTDVLSKGANESKLGFTDMVQAIAPISGVAAQVGLSLEQTVASIAKLRDTGLPAAEASTQLRQILLQLIAPPQELKKQMDALGLSITKADGSSRSFPEVLDKIAAVANSGAKGVEFLGRVFGTYATNGALALAKSRDAVREFSGSLADSEGAAKKWADTVNGNGVEAAKNYERQLANARRELGEQLQPILVDFYTNIAPQFVKGLGTIVDALERVNNALGQAKVSAKEWADQYGSSLSAAQAQTVAGLLQRRKQIEAQIELLQKQLESPVTKAENALGLNTSGILQGRINQLKKELGEIITQLIEIQKQTQKAVEPKPTIPNAFQQALATLSGGSYVKTQGAGENPNQMGYGAQGHNGLDIVSQSGKIFNPFDQARVIATGFDKYLGNFIKLALDNNTEVILGHFKTIGVEAGQVLAKGTLLGIQGATGNATGPHVHIGFKVGGKTVYDEAELERLMAQFAASGAQSFDEGLLQQQGRGKEKSPVLETAKDLENQLKILDAQFARSGSVKTYKAGLTDLAAAFKALLGSATTLEEKATIEKLLADISGNFDDLDKSAAAARKKAKERADKARKEEIEANDRMAAAIRENQARQAEQENRDREARLAANKAAAEKEQAENERLAQGDVDLARWVAQQKEEARLKALAEQQAVEQQAAEDEQTLQEIQSEQTLQDIELRKQAVIDANKSILENTLTSIRNGAVLTEDQLLGAVDAADALAAAGTDVGDAFQLIAEAAARSSGIEGINNPEVLQNISQGLQDVADAQLQYADNLEAANREEEDSARVREMVDEASKRAASEAQAEAEAKLRLVEAQKELNRILGIVVPYQEQIEKIEELKLLYPELGDQLDRLIEKYRQLQIEMQRTNRERDNESSSAVPHGNKLREKSSGLEENAFNQIKALSSEIESLFLNSGKTLVKGLLDGKPLEALQSVFSSASDFFINKMVEGILGPIAEELGRVAVQNLFSSTAGSALSLNPAGLVIGGIAILGSLLLSNLNKPSAAQQASQDAAKNRSPGTVNLKVETAISVALEGTLDTAQNRASLTTLVENINMAQLRKLGVFELIEELKRSRP